MNVNRIPVVSKGKRAAGVNIFSGAKVKKPTT